MGIFTHTALTVEHIHICLKHFHILRTVQHHLPGCEQVCALTWGWTWPARPLSSRSAPRRRTRLLRPTPCPLRSARGSRWWTPAGWRFRPGPRPAGQISGRPRPRTPAAPRRWWGTRFSRSARSCPRRRRERGSAAALAPLRSCLRWRDVAGWKKKKKEGVSINLRFSPRRINPETLENCQFILGTPANRK